MPWHVCRDKILSLPRNIRMDTDIHSPPSCTVCLSVRPTYNVIEVFACKPSFVVGLIKNEHTHTTCRTL